MVRLLLAAGADAAVSDGTMGHTCLNPQFGGSPKAVELVRRHMEAEIAACAAAIGPAEARAALDRPPSVAPESGEESLAYFVTAARETF